MDGLNTAPKNNVEEGKSRMSLLPMDLLRKYLVPAYEEGIIKYHRESWRKGFKTSVMLDAAERHITDFFYLGEDVDPDSPTGKHHLAGAIFSLIAILNMLETRPELDDRMVKDEYRNLKAVSEQRFRARMQAEFDKLNGIKPACTDAMTP